MFLRWLLTKFPKEMRAAWSLIRADLLVWLAVSVVIVASAFVSTPGGGASSPLFGALIAATAGIFVMVMMPLLFQAAADGEHVAWSDVFATVARRALPTLYYVAIAVTMSRAADSIVRVALSTLLDETPVRPYASAAVGIVVFITLLSRFCFVSFLAVLDRRTDIVAERVPGMRLAPLSTLAWPLLASSSMSDGRRWSLAPYVVLSIAAPLPAVFTPPMVRAPLVIVLQLVAFTAMAVLFNYYREQRSSVVGS